MKRLHKLFSSVTQKRWNLLWKIINNICTQKYSHAQKYFTACQLGYRSLRSIHIVTLMPDKRWLKSTEAVFRLLFKHFWMGQIQLLKKRHFAPNKATKNVSKGEERKTVENDFWHEEYVGGKFKVSFELIFSFRANINWSNRRKVWSNAFLFSYLLNAPGNWTNSLQRK